LVKFKKQFRFTTKEIALISVFSSLWIVSQIYLGPVISQITHVHGVIQRLMGWLLMLTLAELSRGFGRVSAMSAIAAWTTRIVRRSASLYTISVGIGYTLGGVAFDLLFFLPIFNKFKGKTRKAYLLFASVLSGVIAIVPYLFYRLYFLGFYGFIAWIPLYVPSAATSLILSFLGTLIGVYITPQIKVLSLGKEYTENP
jgi:hypothetical protein